jgi:hypothetical protein
MTGSHEVRGSIPLGSTNICKTLRSVAFEILLHRFPGDSVAQIAGQRDLWHQEQLAHPLCGSGGRKMAHLQ